MNLIQIRQGGLEKQPAMTEIVVRSPTVLEVSDREKASTSAKVAERLRKCLQSITTPVRIRTLAFCLQFF
jgi:hypothetical protein